jgi:hypothetical protein
VSRCKRPIGTESRLLVARCWEEDGIVCVCGGVTSRGCGLLFGDDENILNFVMAITQLHEYTKTIELYTLN